MRDKNTRRGWFGKSLSLTEENRTCLIYREGDHTLDINCELRPSCVKYDYVVWIEDLKWNNPHEDETISESDRDRILFNIRVLAVQKGLLLDFA